MDYKQILDYLHANIDTKYKEFHTKLIPGNDYNILGVRAPLLQKLAKQIAKEDYAGFLSAAQDDTHEERMLQALVIGYIKTDFEKLSKYVRMFVPKINNWAVCDCFCSALKITSKHSKPMLEIVRSYISSAQEYERRFAIIMLMNYYLTDEYIDYVLDTYNSINCSEYYTSMGVAWGVSICFVKHEQKTMDFLKHNNLDYATYNRSLQKIIESNRVSAPNKQLIRGMKHKIKIKLINKNTLDSAISLVNEVFREFVAVDYSQQGLQTFNDYLENKQEGLLHGIREGSTKIWGYYIDETLAGVIATRNVSHISLLFVDKRHHKKGVAKALLNAVKALMPAREITVNSSPYAVKIYERLGFVATNCEQQQNGIKFTPMKHVW